MSFLLELWDFMRVRKKMWMMPIIIMALVFGGLVILARARRWRRSFTRSSESPTDANPRHLRLLPR